jgi:hypothetical protein
MHGMSSRDLHRLFPAVLAWAVALLGLVCPALAQPDENAEASREYAIKAAYLYQFSRYVQWPASAFADENAPLVIGVLGKDPFGGSLEEIARTKRIEGRPIAIRRFASMTDYTPCHILFINSSVSPEQKQAAIQKAKRAPILLVGEEPGFAEQGGTINFFFDENKIRFEINATAAKHDQLKISSKLLSLAKIVGHY